MKSDTVLVVGAKIERNQRNAMIVNLAMIGGETTETMDVVAMGETIGVGTTAVTVTATVTATATVVIRAAIAGEAGLATEDTEESGGSDRRPRNRLPRRRKKSAC
mmetsp:Transcript_75775/g.152253  ORF Transcript_75775/g.152253 Transcript_75775/m.152253 type:complete len:105 (-) Transcript_75775:1432-1746(-)